MPYFNLQNRQRTGIGSFQRQQRQVLQQQLFEARRNQGRTSENGTRHEEENLETSENLRDLVINNIYRQGVPLEVYIQTMRYLLRPQEVFYVALLIWYI